VKSLVLCSLAFFLGAAPADLKHEPQLKQVLADMNKLSEVLEGMKDADTAKKAAKPLDEAVTKFLKEQQKMKDLGQPSEEDAKTLKDKYGNDITKSVTRLQKAFKTASEAGPESKALVEKAAKKLRGEKE
jgi:hypothetical protein